MRTSSVRVRPVGRDRERVGDGCAPSPDSRDKGFLESSGLVGVGFSVVLGQTLGPAGGRAALLLRPVDHRQRGVLSGACFPLLDHAVHLACCASRRQVERRPRDSPDRCAGASQERMQQAVTSEPARHRTGSQARLSHQALKQSALSITCEANFDLGTTGSGQFQSARNNHRSIMTFSHEPPDHHEQA